MSTPSLLQFQLDITGVAIVTTATPKHVPTGAVLLHGRRDALEFLNDLRGRTDSDALSAALEAITLTERLLDSSELPNYHIPPALLRLFLKLLRTGMRVCCAKKKLQAPLEAISGNHRPPLLQHACVIREQGRLSGSTALILYTSEKDEVSVAILGRFRDAVSFVHECCSHLSPEDRNGLIDSLEWLPKRGPAAYFVDSYTAALLHVGHITLSRERHPLSLH